MPAPGPYEYAMVVVLVLLVICFLIILARKCQFAIPYNQATWLAIVPLVPAPAPVPLPAHLKHQEQCLIIEQSHVDNPQFNSVSTFLGTSTFGEGFTIIATLVIGLLLGLNIGNPNAETSSYGKYFALSTLGLVVVFLCPYTDPKYQPGFRKRSMCCFFCNIKLVNILHVGGFIIYTVGLCCIASYECYGIVNDTSEREVAHDIVFAILFWLCGCGMIALAISFYGTKAADWGARFFCLEAFVVVASLTCHVAHDVGNYFQWY